ncbi:glutaredoxin family protein [Paenibacillus thiaminolyticus]|uniref:Glutaredoxin family protein n=1 Tax=Paenibacillus thiaminolyticus TaxID=49283 RepID=A0A3A3GB26_PANTH|nr:glutaredoxin family protein [Paenibacillus thiaminolyticus]RJG20423.1 glutaredoxin family protein [Paenibacillus thiaminolyticus]
MEEKVIIYTSTYCQYCSHVKKFLGERNVDFEERNIDKDEKYAEELWNTGLRAVPVTLVGETMILGFNQIQLNQALAARE